MPEHIRIEALRRAQQFAETIRRAGASIDRRTAPGLAQDLVRASHRLVAALSLDDGAAMPPGPLRRRLTAALAAHDELGTLLAMAVGLEVLGARGPRLVSELRHIRGLLSELRRRRDEIASGDSAA